MAITMNTVCLECYIRKNLKLARTLGNEQQTMAFAKALMQLYLDAPEGVPSPYMGPKVADLLHEMYGVPIDRFRQEKIDSNDFFLQKQDIIREKVESGEDPVYTGLQFAILGNYLDYSALQGNVSFDTLDEMLSKAYDMNVDGDTYARMCRDFQKGKKLLYLTDNAGEIGFDRIFAEQIARVYPNLQITFCVRGDICQNDATRADAAVVGVPFPVIDNGNRVAGTMFGLLSDECRKAMDEADVILSKGMGNMETLYGCGYPIYYAFLVKCQHFVEILHQPLFTPMLVDERNKP